FRSVGSYWVDLRVHGYTLSSGTCSNLVQVAGITQFRLCDPFASGGGIFAVFPNVQTPGGVPNEDNPPNLQVIQVSQTTPAVLTLASVPPAAAVSVGSAITIWGVNDSSCAGLNGNHIVTHASELSVTVDYDGSGCTYTNGAKVYGQDILLRFQVNLDTNQISGETWNVDGTGYTSNVQQIQSVNGVSLPETGLQIGPAPVNLAYLRWCKGSVPLNSTPPNSGLTTPCGGNTVLADWEFEGNTADSGPNRLPLSFSPNPSYVSTPNYIPACNPGPQQSFRGGSTLSMEWQYVPSSESGTPLQTVHWTSSQLIPVATFDGFEAGPLNFQLS